MPPKPMKKPTKRSRQDLESAPPALPAPVASRSRSNSRSRALAVAAAESSDDDQDEFISAEINGDSDSDSDSDEADSGSDDEGEEIEDADRELSEEMLQRFVDKLQRQGGRTRGSSASRQAEDEGEEEDGSSEYSELEEDDDGEGEEDEEVISDVDDGNDSPVEEADGPVIVPGDNNGIPWGGSLSDDEDKVKPRLIRPEIVPETDSDDSDREEHHNTVGNIPMEWYNDYPHIGYDLDGKKILKPATADELDKFLSKMDDPTFWTSIHDKQDQKDIELSQEELDIINKLQSADYAADGFDPYQSTVEWFTSDRMIAPLTGRPEPKRRFIPSKWEHKKVIKIVRAIRNGWIVPKKPKTAATKYYDVWGNVNQEDAEARLNHPMHMPAPKAKLPGNIESYNPPEEYLFTEEERKQWEEQDPEDRKIDFIPQKYDSLRKVPAYTRFVHDRFERCLDLYLCPRVKKTRTEIDPEALIPKLPDPKDLEPFPTSLSLVFRGHTSRVRSFSLSPSGQFLLSGADDGMLRLWEVATTRCLHIWKLDDTITTVSWNPSKGLSLAAVAAGNDVYLIHLPSVADGITADAKVAQQTLVLLQGEAAPVAQRNSASGIPLVAACEWRKPTRKLAVQGVLWAIHHQRDVTSATWHRKGDYLVTTAHNAGAASVQIHQMSRKQTQQPFKKNKGLVTQAMFHPTRPHLLLATQRYVRVYDLQQQVLLKKLTSGCKWISSMDLHPAGDNVIVGSYDKRLCWWDLELGVQPYKTLRYHKQALRSVAFHPKYPLFASASDDGTIQVFHGMVYQDLLTNPLIVPVKILRAHQPVDNIGALKIQWHPTQPWIVSSGADGTVKLWT